jgi:alpha 1,2-mannosyltransferase
MWHLKEELSPQNITLLKSFRVSLKAFEDFVSPEQLAPIEANVGLRRFQLKPLAIMHSHFEEVLLIDSDNGVVTNPDYLFEHPQYIATGAIFWPDYWRTSVKNPIWTIVDVPPEDTWEQESGQLLIHKHLSWEALQVCLQFNTPMFMTLLNGDKDTFRFAWMALRKSYHMVEHRALPLGMASDSGRFCGHSILQFVVIVQCLYWTDLVQARP